MDFGTNATYTFIKMVRYIGEYLGFTTLFTLNFYVISEDGKKVLVFVFQSRVRIKLPLKLFI